MDRLSISAALARSPEARTCRAEVAPSARPAPPRPDGRASLSPDPASPAARDPRGCSSPFPRRASLRRRLRPRENAATLLRGARACLALLAAAALLALAAPAQAQTEVWTATLTPGDLSSGILGCSVGVATAICSSTSVLSEDSFNYDSTDYNITGLFLRSNGRFEFRVHTDITTDTLADLTLVVGSTSLVLSGGTASGAFTRYWNSSGVSLTEGTDITVKLTAASTSNAAPTVANAILDQTATAGTALNYAFPANTFADTDPGDTLTYTATKSDDSALPSWLSFAPATRTFSGTPTAAEVGTVSVKVTASDGTDSIIDTFDIVVSAANIAPIGAPTITGTARVGWTLTAVTTGITDANGLTSPGFTYQWIRVNGTEADIAGENSSTYILVAADLGKTIKVKVNFTDDDGYAETLTSGAYPTSGTVQADSTLVSNVGQPGGRFYGFGSHDLAQPFTTGANVTGYTLTSIELNLDSTQSAITPTVKLYSGSANGTEEATFTGPAMLGPGSANYTFTPSSTVILLRSTTYWVVAEGTGNVLWRGTVTDEDATSAADWEIGDIAEARTANATGNFARELGAVYKIRVNGTLGGLVLSNDATLSALALEDASDDSAITISPVFASATTSYTASVDNDVDEITIEPTVNESNATVEYLDSTDTAITDANSVKTGQQVSLSEGANTIKVKVTAEDTTTTNPYTVVVTRAAAPNTAATGAPAISGTATVGQVLTATTGTIADADGLPSNFTYQWVRVDADGTSNEADITGENSSTYTLDDDDEGKKIKVKVSFTDTGGNSEMRTSGAYPTSGTVQASSTPVSAALVSNTGPTGSRRLNVNPFFVYAQGFSTGNSAAELGSVTLADLTDVAAGESLVVSLYSESAGSPGTSLHTLTAPGTLSNGDATFTVPTGTTVTLEATTSYFIHIAFPGATGVVKVSTTDSDTEDLGSTIGWSLADIVKVSSRGGAFGDHSAPDRAIRLSINGTLGTTTTNNAPTSADEHVEADEDMDYTFSSVDFPFTDTAGDSLASVKIVTLPASGTGTLTLSGTTIGSGDLPQTVLAAEIDDLKYSPPANLHGTDVASFTFKVNDGTDDSADTYTMNINVGPENDPATGEPTISGTARVGRMLAASTAGIMDVDGLPSTFSYQWLRKAGATTTSISGANSSTYTLQAADLGNKVAVRVSFTDDDGSSETLTSAATATVTTAITVSYVPLESDVTEGAGSIDLRISVTSHPTAGTPQAFEVLLSTADGTATVADDYVVVPGQLIQFGIGDTSKDHTILIIDDSVVESDETFTSTLSIGSGQPAVIDTRTDFGATATITIKDDDTANTAPTSADEHVEADEDTDYTFSSADFPFTDTAGDSLASVKIVTLPASGKGTLTLSGTAIGSGDLPKTVLAAEIDDLKYSPPANLYGTDFATFTFKVNDGTVDSDDAFTITVDVTAMNDPATGKPGITGTAQVGQTLNATAGTIADLDGLPDPLISDGLTTIQWIQVDGATETDISGATNETYTLATADEGKKIKVKVSFEDEGGTAEGPLTSDAYPASATVSANNAPVFSPATPEREIAENTAAGVDVGAAVTATDADAGDNLTYMLGGADMASFDFVGTSGQIRTKTNVSYDFEAKSSYTVTVTATDNSNATAVADVTISITDVDEPPSAPATPMVSAVSGSTTSLSVSWAAPANAGKPAIANYDVQYRVGSSGGWSDGPVDVAGTSTTITSLVASTDYEARVRATNAEGDSGWSDPPGSGRTNTPTNNAPVFSPAMPEREIAENTAAGVDVGAPVTATDADAGDNLTYMLGGADMASFDFVGTTGQIRTKTNVSYDFEAKSSYTVTVTASDGTSTTRATVTISITDVAEPPDAPTTISVSAVAGSTTSLTVSWTAPANAGRPAIDNYDVQYRVSGAAAWTDGPQNVTTTTTTISGLVADTLYEVQVRATNAEGDSGWSDPPVSGRTNSPANNAPEFATDTTSRSFTETVGDAAVSTAGNVGAVVTATDADSDTLTYSLEGTDVAKFGIVSGSGQIQTKVGEKYDREAKASYSVTVKADDSNGGSDTIAVTITVDNAVEKPLAPAMPAVTATSGITTSLDVSWMAPANTGRPAITGYKVEYRAGVSGNWINHPHTGTGTTATIATLTAATAYQVQVLAVNSDGDGLFSSPGSGTTGTNTPATGVPTITGTAQVGQTLTAVTTGIADANGLTSPTYTYQWIRANGTEADIAAANSSTYTLDAADLGKTIKVKVSFADDDGNPETLTSAATATVTAAPTAQTEVWTATLTPGDLNFSILGCGNHIDSARCSTTTVLSEDSFNYDSTDYTITKLFVRSGGHFQLDFDADITTATAALTLVVGSTSLVLADADTIASRQRIWHNSGVSLIAGTDITVKLTAPDTNTSSDATLSALALEDASDDSAITISPAFASGMTSYTASVDNDVDEITIKPAVNESHAMVEYLDSTDTAITDADSGKTGQQVSLSVSANTIKVKVTAEDTTTTNTYTVVVTRAANNAPTAVEQLVDADEDTDYTFTADDFGFADTDAGDSLVSVKIVTLPASGTGTLTLSGTAIGSGDLPKTVPADDLEELKYSPPANLYGTDVASFTFKVNDGTVDSDNAYTMTIDVKGMDDPVTGKPGITGTAQVGQTLTATAGTIADVDGLPNPFFSAAATTIQWIQVDGATETDISGATNETYTLATADEGKKIKVKVSFEDEGGTAEGPLTSDAYPSSGTVLGANNAPVFSPAMPEREIAENTAAGVDVGAAVTATDADAGDNLTYMLGGADMASFDFVGTTGQIRTKTNVSYDFEAKSSYTVTVTATDNSNATAVADVTISITDVAEPPSAPATPMVSAVSGSTTSLSVSWAAPANAGKPAIANYDVQYRAGSSGTWTDGQQDVTTTSTTITSLTANTLYQARVRATNAEGDSGWSEPPGSGRTNTLTNNAPVFDPAMPEREIAENTAAGVNVGAPVTATDADAGDTLGYTLGGADVASFDFVETTGQIRTKAGVSYDHEAKASYTVTVTATDGTATADASVTISVTDVDEPPSAPATPAVSAVSGSTTRLTVSWAAPANAGKPAIANYDVQYRLGSSGAWIDGPQDVMTMTATVTGLVADTLYEARVRATNAEGDSGWSDPPGSGRTNAPGTSAPVRAPLPPGSGFLVGNFGQPADGASQISVTRDIVGVFTTGARGAELHNIEFRLFSRLPDSAQLPSATLYSASVTDTRARRGERVAALTAAPGSPRPSATAQTVAFTAPAGTRLEAGATYLVVLEEHSYVRAESTTYPAEDAGGASGWTIDGIGSGNASPYSYETTASLLMRVNGTAAGATVATAPDAPAGLGVAAGDARVRLIWAPPRSDGGAGIEKYQYRYSAGSRVDPDTAWTDVPDGSDTGTSRADERSVSVTELDNGRQYAFELRAVNGVRAGAAATATATPAAARRTGFLVSNFGQPVDGSSQIYVTQDIVGAFTAGALGATLDSIELRLYSRQPDIAQRPSATLYRGSVTDTRATLGTRVATLTAAPGSPRPAASAQTIVFTAPGGTRLEAGATYLVVLEGSGYVRVEDTNSFAQDAGGASGWAIDGIGAGNNSPYSYRTTASLLMSVNGTTARAQRAVREEAAKDEQQEEEQVQEQVQEPATSPDPDRGISLSTSSSSAIEGEAVTISVRRAGPTDRTTTVAVQVLDSALTGAWPIDVKLRSGVATATATVAIPFDGARPASRTVTVRLASVEEPYSVGSPSTLTFNVTDRDAALSVDDASVSEGPGATLAFAVTLDPTRDREVRVKYATSDGTATQGDDYTGVSGTLRFAAGETTKTVSVTVLDDAHDEGSETLTLTLSRPRHAVIDDDTAVGTIVNSDPLPDAWLSRFGRAASDQVVQSIGRRLEGGARESHLTVMGWRMDSLFESSHAERDAREPRPDALDRQPDGSVRAPDGRIGAAGAMTGAMTGATRGVGAMSGPGAARPAFDGAMTQGFPPMQGGTLQSPARAMGGLPANAGGNPRGAGGVAGRAGRSTRRGTRTGRRTRTGREGSGRSLGQYAAGAADEGWRGRGRSRARAAGHGDGQFLLLRLLPGRRPAAQHEPANGLGRERLDPLQRRRGQAVPRWRGQHRHPWRGRRVGPLARGPCPVLQRGRGWLSPGFGKRRCGEQHAHRDQPLRPLPSR